MDAPQSLQTVAEVSIAFAGFSGLVVALRKNAGPLTEVQKYRLRVLLTLSFGALFLSMLPELLMLAGLATRKTWLVAGSVATIFSLAFLVWWLVASRRIVHRVPEIFDWFAVARMAAGHLLIVFLLVASMTPWFGEHYAAAYVAALVWYLMHAAQQFSRMLFIQPRNDGPDTL
jgi:lipid-A-disaccharide synthase-like uncharacterized protein